MAGHIYGRGVFAKFSRCVASWTGRSMTFVLALAMVFVWAVTGPLFGFSNTWQLVINTGTTIITFLMVFLIQHTQNSDSYALQLKLDELIRVTKDANTGLLDLEELEEDELIEIRKQYEVLAQEARKSA
jgi:low affinity Fe/Cu permease